MRYIMRGCDKIYIVCAFILKFKKYFRQPVRCYFKAFMLRRYFCSDNTRTQDYTPEKNTVPEPFSPEIHGSSTYAVRHVPHTACHSVRIHQPSCFCQHRSFSDKVYILCNNSSQYFHNLIKCRRCLFPNRLEYVRPTRTVTQIVTVQDKYPV